MLSPTERIAAAERLRKAEAARGQAEPLSRNWPDLVVEDAYAIQKINNDLKVKAGRAAVGHKVGLTSKAMQRAWQFDGPFHGTLFSDHFHDDGVRLKRDDYRAPFVELEFGFVLARPLKGPGVRLADAMSATEWVVPSIEIIDSRVENPRTIPDTIADNGVAAGVVTGGRPVRPADIDLRWAAGLLYSNETIEESGVAASVFGHPALGVAWLANALGEEGIGLDAGHFILSGSLVRPVAVDKGDTVRADFGPLGSVAVHFE